MSWVCLLRGLVTVLAAGLMFGCGGNDSDSSPAVLPAGFLQIVNAIIDSPELSVEVTLDDETRNMGELGFQAATGIVSMDQETYSMAVTYIDPVTGDSADLIVDADLDITVDTIHTVVIRGSFASPNLLFLEKPLGDVGEDDSEDIEVQVVNVGADTVAVYFGDPDLGVTGESLLGTLTSGSNTEPVLLPEGSYRLRITDDGSSVVVYDSGEFDFARQSRRVIVVSDNFGPDPATKSAFILTENGTVALSNGVARSGLRIINAVADEADVTVDIIEPTSQVTINSVTLNFPDVSEYVNVDPSFVNVSVAVASAPGEASNSTVSLNEDTYFTIIVAGSGIEDAISIRASSANQRPFATGANLHFVNTLRDTDVEDFDRVDLYALALGDSLADSGPKFSQIGYLGSTSSTLPATAFDLVLTTAGTQSILAGPVRISVDGSTSLLVVAAEAFGGGVPRQIVVHRTQLN
jgi:hypothetical protein